MKKRILSFVLALTLFTVLALPASADDSAANGDAVLHAGAPSGLALSSDGALLITDVYNKVIWSVSAGGEPQLYAGKIGVADLAGEPVGGYKDAETFESFFQSPWDIVPFLDGYLVSDTKNHLLRFIGTDDRVKTAIGANEPGYTEGIGIAARLNSPTGLAVDENGNAYVADTGNHVIRKISPDGVVSTFAGSSEGASDGSALSASFRQPTGLYYRNGALYVADSGNHLIRKVQNGQVSTIAGTRFSSDDDRFSGGGYLDGPADTAQFSNPQGLAVDDEGIIYVADSANAAIREIRAGQVTTLLKADGAAGATYPVSPRGLLVDAGNLYIADPFAGVVFVPGAILSKNLLGFGDVLKTDWFAPAVSFVYESGLFMGTSAETFSPNMPMNRAMFVTVLSRLYQNGQSDALISGTAEFSDLLSGQYYTDAVRWAADNQLVLGSGGKFMPEQNITREAIVTLLFRYAAFAGLDTTGQGRTLSDFSDGGSVSDWAADAVLWAVSSGIIRGDTGGRINPQTDASRAETAQMLMNFSISFNLAAE